MKNTTFGFSPEEWELIKIKLIKPLKEQGARVWVFGSRARGDHQRFSDLDILYNIHLELNFLNKLNETLEESNISVKIELVEENKLAKSYFEKIQMEKIEI